MTDREQLGYIAELFGGKKDKKGRLEFPKYRISFNEKGEVWKCETLKMFSGKKYWYEHSPGSYLPGGQMYDKITL